jgi:hypothetical protein
MNENLIPETNLALMKQVERAVRPVPAGRKRKLQMREELLAHLTAIYQEELPRQPSESAALSAAFDRFGSPAEISAELARGVTWMQRLYYTEEQVGRFFGRWIPLRSEDSLLRYTGRLLVWMTLLGAFTLVVFVFMLWLLRATYEPLLLPLIIKLVSHSVVSFLCYFWAIRSIERSWFGNTHGQRWGLAVAMVLAWLTVFTGLSFIASYLIDANLEKSVGRIPDFLVANAFFSLTGVFLTAWCFHDMKRKNKPYEVWTRLELEE